MMLMLLMYAVLINGWVIDKAKKKEMTTQVVLCINNGGVLVFSKDDLTTPTATHSFKHTLYAFDKTQHPNGTSLNITLVKRVGFVDEDKEYIINQHEVCA